MSLGLRVLVVVNKIDKPAARPEYVIDKTFDLFCELGASDEQTDFPIVYTSAINRIAGPSPDEIGEGEHPPVRDDCGCDVPPPPVVLLLFALLASPRANAWMARSRRRSTKTRMGAHACIHKRACVLWCLWCAWLADMEAVFQSIMDLPKPKADIDGSLQLQISNIASDNFIGRLGIGRIRSGTLKKNQPIGLSAGPGTPVAKVKVSELFNFDAMGRASVDEASAGDIVVFSGVSDFNIGDTLVDPEDPRPLEPIEVEQPTMSITFGVNKSPFGGRSGKLLTSRNIRDRLAKELEVNVALRVEDTDDGDTVLVSGRGLLHLTVLAAAAWRCRLPLPDNHTHTHARTQAGRQTDRQTDCCRKHSTFYSTADVVQHRRRRAGLCVHAVGVLRMRRCLSRRCAARALS